MLKPWMWLAFSVFIAIASYQVGFNRGKLANMDADKQRLTTLIERELNINAPVPHEEALSKSPENIDAQSESESLLTNSQVANEAMLPIENTVARLEKSAEAGRQTRDAQRDFVDNYDYTQLNEEAVTHFEDFFALQPNGDKVDLQSLRCDNKQCQLIGQYNGPHDELGAMVDAMREQDWWNYTSTSSSTQSDNNVTHFVLFLQRANATSEAGH